jgi:hypothetical protein
MFFYLYIFIFFKYFDVAISNLQNFNTTKSEIEFHKSFTWLKRNIGSYIKHRSGHQMFDFITAFGPCNGTLRRYPGDFHVDGGKYVCDSVFKTKRKCLIYSFGSNNNFKFEIQMWKKFKCEIHVFDCFAKDSWKIPRSIFFHKWCIGKYNYKNFYNFETILVLLNHEKVDYLKLDIEGSEFDSILSLKNISNSNLPNQISVEIHIDSKISKLTKFEKMKKIVNFVDTIIELGYKVLSKENNYRCPLCSEVVFIKD